MSDKSFGVFLLLSSLLLITFSIVAGYDLGVARESSRVVQNQEFLIYDSVLYKKVEGQ